MAQNNNNNKTTEINGQTFLTPTCDIETQSKLGIFEYISLCFHLIDKFSKLENQYLLHCIRGRFGADKC